MKLDAKQVKQRISLKELFERDGHELKRMGSDYVCRCPVHDEKTPSCVVHEQSGYFKCHGCGWGGDCFIYWQKTRTVEFPDALQALGAIAGLTSGATPAPVRVVRNDAPEELAPRLSGRDCERWLQAVDLLREDTFEQERLAKWRGYSVETVRWAVKHGLLGRVSHAGAWREAFLVERPTEDGRMPVGFHVRLAPESPNNPGKKASWRFVPQGIGSWPLVVGDLRSAKILFFLEGQWDALALVDCMWGGDAVVSPEGCPRVIPPHRVAVIAMRGATSWKRLAHYTWPAEATAFLLGQDDKAGRGWMEEGNLADTLRQRCAHVWAFFPNTQGLDFNDLWKRGAFTRDSLATAFREKMVKRGHGRKKATGKTFLQFCRGHKEAQESLGEIARLVCADRRAPRGRKPLRNWQRWLGNCVPEEQHPAFYQAWSVWRKEAA